MRHLIYAVVFGAAIAAGAWSMMGSYNRVNGRYACESGAVLAIPRNRWGWRGFYCPDFLHAVRDDAAALAAGLDLPALGGPAGRTRAMVDATPRDERTALVANLVRALIGSGLADDPPEAGGAPSTDEHRALAERVAIESAVLLTNRDAALPLGPDVRRVALDGEPRLAIEPVRVHVPAERAERGEGEEEAQAALVGAEVGVGREGPDEERDDDPEGEGPGRVGDEVAHRLATAGRPRSVR